MLRLILTAFEFTLKTSTCSKAILSLKYTRCCTGETSGQMSTSLQCANYSDLILNHACHAICLYTEYNFIYIPEISNYTWVVWNIYLLYCYDFRTCIHFCGRILLFSLGSSFLAYTWSCCPRVDHPSSSKFDKMSVITCNLLCQIFNLLKKILKI